jgi:uncharacterized protein YjbI with pentapeptide repeats
VADAELVARAKQGSAAWNSWRREIEDATAALQYRLDFNYADLRGVDLSHSDLAAADLRSANLTNANLSHARLRRADLSGADLSGSDLTAADLRSANLTNANLSGARLSRADLSSSLLGRASLLGADLSGANLTGVELSDANLTGAQFNETVLANLDFTRVTGLNSCVHIGPSPIDFRTLERSNPLPLAFLRGVGMPAHVIEYLPSLLHPVQYYSCFISYSAKDDSFARRLHADLQAAGVRCWFAPQDLPIGAKILDEIDAAIRLRDKVLLVLSERSIESDWVESEVVAALEEERRRKQTVLLPIRLDDAVMKAKAAWAGKLRNRHIGDFSGWNDSAKYQRDFSRFLRDLTTLSSIESKGR